MNNRPLMISVVRDEEMYAKCIAQNPYCQTCELRMLDNRAENIGIAKRYNQFLEGFDYGIPRWLIFCHEDFQLQEDLTVALESADTSKIYGPIGPRLLQHHKWCLGGMWLSAFCGVVVESDKDGANPIAVGSKVGLNEIVNTVDCQCLIVHSSLIHKYGLRYDEHLTFDLYTEDFCINANVNYGVLTAVLPFKCHHYSRGRLLPRFFEQKAYLDRKYPKTEFAGSVGYTIGGGRTAIRRIQKRFRSFLDKRAPWAVDLIFRLSNCYSSHKMITTYV